jgi:hypothetical protein
MNKLGDSGGLFQIMVSQSAVCELDESPNSMELMSRVLKASLRHWSPPTTTSARFRMRTTWKWLGIVFFELHRSSSLGVGANDVIDPTTAVSIQTDNSEAAPVVDSIILRIKF